MDNELTINKDRFLPPSMDYHFLRQEGLKHIERLGNSLWTDYNTHDPGITMLEVLTYAITELGYRANFDFADLITGKNGAISNNTFFAPDKIMVNAPLTEIDYRKLLYDVNGVANAWLLATKETTDADGFKLPNNAEKAVYIDKLDNKLSFHAVNSEDEVNKPLHIRGLNKVILELDEDPVFGDLNATVTEFEYSDDNEDGKWFQTTIFPPFEKWNSPEMLLMQSMPGSEGFMSQVFNTDGTKNELTMLLSNHETAIPLRFIIEVRDTDETGFVKEHFEKQDNVKQLIEFFSKKKEIADVTLRDAAIVLQANRNFTEDYLTPEVIDSIFISVCASVDLKPEVQPASVMLGIQEAIYEVLNPTVKFYSLSELFQKGYSTTDIFNGPKLQHGFLIDEELEKSQLPTSIHASDIIAAIMKIPGVEKVRELLLTAYDHSGNVIEGKSNVMWCLKLPGTMRPTFLRNRSSIKMYRNAIPFFLSDIDEQVIDQQIAIYKSQRKVQRMNSPNMDMPLPGGAYYNLETYYSIQDDFPATYGLGSKQLPNNVDVLRKAQVKQLQGYLYFYEQILADLFSQLYHAKNLLDTKTIYHSYFTNYLGNTDKNGEFYSAGLLTPELKDLYDKEFENVYETREQFYSRRNRSLDHLLARFGESFSDYVFMMYKLKRDNARLEDLSMSEIELIEDKQNFLESYPESSSMRGLGYNYITRRTTKTGYTNYWDTSNIGGYSKRVARLLGINDWPLQPQYYNDGKHYFVLNINDTPAYFNFLCSEEDLPVYKKLANDAISGDKNYRIDKDANFFRVILHSGAKDLIAIDTEFRTEDEARNFIIELTEYLSLPYEYFIILEHILLRPFEPMNAEENPLDPEKKPDLLPVCLTGDCSGSMFEDPYSFQASLVLPGWLGRFANFTFREYAETIFRQEAPALALLKICWVSQSDMDNFLKLYEAWKSTYPTFRKQKDRGIENSPQISAHIKNHRNLLAAMAQLNTTYPVGHLYDCQDSETTTPVILGNTKLGTI